MGDWVADERELLWTYAARVGLLERLGLDADGEVAHLLRRRLATLDPRPTDEILAELRGQEAFREFEASERERVAQSANISKASQELLLRSVEVVAWATLNASSGDIEDTWGVEVVRAPSRRGRAGRAWHRDPMRKRSRRAARLARRKNRAK